MIRIRIKLNSLFIYNIFINNLNATIMVNAGIKVSNDRFFSLDVSLNFINDNDDNSTVSSHCVCVSKDKEKLDHFASVLNEANDIRLTICPRNVISENYVVRLIDYI